MSDPIQSRCDDTCTFMEVTDEGEGCLVLDCRDFHVPSLDQFVRDLCAATGRSQVFILERTDGSPARGIINLQHEDGRVSINGAQLAPDRARRVAAAIVAEAEAAENEPDPAEVTELTQVLWDAMQGGPAKAAAIAALRWMKQRQERQS